MSPLRREHGFAVVTVLLVVLIGLLLGTAVVGQAISTESSVRRDADGRRALQAAKAGLQRARWQHTALSAATADPRTPCVQESGGAYVAVAPARTIGGVPWCADQVEQLGTGERVVFAASGDLDPSATWIERDLVATGSARDGVRRARQRVRGFDVANLFGDYSVVSLEDLRLANNGDIGAPDLAGNARSNGTITLTGGSQICGNATPGPGKTVTIAPGATICPGYTTDPAPEPIALPDVTLPESDDNANVCANGSCPTDGSVAWSAAARTLAMTGSPAVTVRGNVFVLCRLTLSNSATLTFDPIDPASPVRVYFDAPERCGGETTPIAFANNPTLRTTVAGEPAIHAYVAGGATATTVSVDNRNVVLPLQLYAPRSTIAMRNHAVVRGGVVARHVTIAGNVDVLAHTAPTRLQLGTGVAFRDGAFTECTPTTADGASLSGGC